MTDLLKTYEQLSEQSQGSTWIWSMLASKYKLSCFDVWKVYYRGSKLDTSSYTPANTLTDVKLIASLHDAPSTATELLNYLRFTMDNYPWPAVNNKWELRTMKETVVNQLMESMVPYCDLTNTLKECVQNECIARAASPNKDEASYNETDTWIRTLLKGIANTPVYEEIFQWLIENDAPILSKLLTHWDLDKRMLNAPKLLDYFLTNDKTEETVSVILPIILEDTTLPHTAVLQLARKYPKALPEHMFAVKTYLKNQRLSAKSQKNWIDFIAHEIDPASIYLLMLKEEWDYPLKDMKFLNWAPLEKITLSRAMKWYNELYSDNNPANADNFFTQWLQRSQPNHNSIFGHPDCDMAILRDHSINKMPNGSPILYAFWAYALSHAKTLPQDTIKSIQGEWGHNINTPTGKAGILKKYAWPLKEWDTLGNQLELDADTRWNSYVQSILAPTSAQSVDLSSLDMSN